VALRERTRSGLGLLALGAPDFDAAPSPLDDAPAEITRRLDAEASENLLRGAAPDCEDFRDARYSPLPASADEIAEIADVWKASMAVAGPEADAIVELTGSRAQEEAFKLLAPGHRVLHVATHGFFLDGACSAALPDAQGSGPEGRFAVGENPLLLSGLALAGFNRRGAAAEDEDDGVLTAEEIASLDLGAVEWVVLSACETGLGAIRPGEGVLGLRRAFRVAGAGTTIMSLWAVQDETARRWMRHLYRGRSEGLSTAESVRRAAIEMIDEGRTGRRGTHPFYWGAFVAEGDWK
jgi:CHAT domain-containing protein